MVRRNGVIVIDDFNHDYPEIIRFCAEIDINQFEMLGVFEGNELILRKR